MQNSQKDHPDTNKESPALSLGQKIRKEVISFGLIILAVGIFRSVFFEPFRIPSGSMIPTLMIGDFILVNKFSYGFKVPFSSFSLGTFGINFDPIYLFGKKNPKRGDVIVFKFPRDPSTNYIKRVVGLPGDTVEMINKVVYVNDVPVETTKIPGKEIMADMDEGYKNYNFSFYKAKVDKREYVIQLNDDDVFRSDFEKKKIPKGKFFVMGDNRDLSLDSRSWGFVSHKHIKGKALLVWFSMIFPFFSKHKFKFRYWRIGKVIR